MPAVPVSRRVASKEGGRVGPSLVASENRWGGYVPSPFAANHVSMNKKKSCGHTFVPTVPVYTSPVSSLCAVYAWSATVGVWSERWEWEWRSEVRGRVTKVDLATSVRGPYRKSPAYETATGPRKNVAYKNSSYK